MRLRLINADYAPDDLYNQLPVTCKLIRELPGSDRADYWLAKTEKHIAFNEITVDYLIVSPRFVGVTIKPGIGEVVLGVAYVTDKSLINDTNLDFKKCEYVAICMAEETK